MSEQQDVMQLKAELDKAEAAYSKARKDHDRTGDRLNKTSDAAKAARRALAAAVGLPDPHPFGY